MSRPDHFINQAIKSLRQAIEQAERQETNHVTLTQTNVGIGERGMQAYEEAKKRGWVGLTSDEVQGFADQYWEDDNMTMHSLMRAIEAKLKQKNGFTEGENT